MADIHNSKNLKTIEEKNREAYLMYLRWLSSKYLRKSREDAGLTQNAISKALRFDSHTFLSAIEKVGTQNFDEENPNGGPALPEEHWEEFSDLVGISRKDFFKTMVMYLKPSIYKNLFGEPTKRELISKVE